MSEITKEQPAVDTKIVEITALQILHTLVTLNDVSEFSDEDEQDETGEYVPHQSTALRNALNAARSLLKARRGKYGSLAPEFLR